MSEADSINAERWEVFEDAAREALDAEMWERAERLYWAALREAEHFGPNDPRLAHTIDDLLNLYDHINGITEEQARQYLALCLRLLTIEEVTHGPESPEFDSVLDRLARAYAGQNQVAEAEAVYRRMIRIEEATEGVNHPSVASTCVDLALLLAETDRYGEREALWQRAIRITEEREGANSPKLPWMLGYLAQVYEEEGRNAEAISALERAVELRERQQDETTGTSLVNLLRQLASAYLAGGSVVQAVNVYRRAAEFHEQDAARYREEALHSPNGVMFRIRQLRDIDEDLGTTLTGFTSVLRLAGRDAEAAEVAKRAAAIQAAANARTRLLDEVDAIAARSAPV